MQYLVSEEERGVMKTAFNNYLNWLKCSVYIFVAKEWVPRSHLFIFFKKVVKWNLKLDGFEKCE